MNEIEWIGSYFYRESYRGYVVVRAADLVTARELVRKRALGSWDFGLEHFSMSAVVPVCLPGDSVDYRHWREENAKLDPGLAAWYIEEERKGREFQAMLDARWKCHACRDVGWIGDAACPGCGLYGWAEQGSLWRTPP